MNAGSVTKRKWRIRLAGVMSAVLAGSVFLFPSAAGAETLNGSYSVPSQMEAMTRKIGDAAGSPGTMSEIISSSAGSSAGSSASRVSLPGIVYDSEGRFAGYSGGQGTSRSSSYAAATGNMSGYANPIPSNQIVTSSQVAPSSQVVPPSPGYILDGGGAASGPGAVLAPAAGSVVTLENSVNSTTGTQNGPKVTEITLRESRYDDYGVYSEAMSDSMFIYSSVANNGITDQPVTLEFPAQMRCTAEKDGVPFTYTSGTPVSEYGTYVMKFLVVTNPSAPVISQNVLRSVFTFHIRKKTADAAAADAAAAGAGDMISDLWPGILPESVPESMLESVPAPEILETEPAAAQPEETLPAETEAVETEPAAPEAQSDFYLQEYDAASGLYRIALPDGRSFTSTVLNGFLSPYAVDLDLSGLGSLDGIRLLENGEETPVKEQMSLNYAGSYILLIPTDDGTVPFSVRLPGEKTRNLGRYTVPDGVKVLSMTKNGRNVPGADTADTLDFSEDAVYSLRLEDMAGSKYDVAFEVDSQPPQFTVAVGKGIANITYQSDDVGVVALKKSDGSTFRYEAPISTVNEPGSYRITVLDEAGNRSTETFTIQKQINPATPIAVILLLGLIGGGIWYFRRTRKNTSVR